MGRVVVLNGAGEPIVLRNALALVWDELEEGRSVEALRSSLSDRDGSVASLEEVERALESLAGVGLATSS